MSGNLISVRTLNLDCEFAEIAAQLDEIVNLYFYKRQYLTLKQH